MPQENECNAIYDLYQEVYEELSDIKHLVYSSIRLVNPESLAVFLSKLLCEKMDQKNNEVWIVSGQNNVIQTAFNGMLVPIIKRRVIGIESSEMMTHVIKKQLVRWPSNDDIEKSLFPAYKLPFIFPIKADSMAFGFYVIDKVTERDISVAQFLSQFYGMIFSISNLHEKVMEQKNELNELTELLFYQNSNLAALHHIGLEVAKSIDLKELCKIITSTTVEKLGAHKAAILLLDDESRRLNGISQNGGLTGIENVSLDIEFEVVFKHALTRGRIINWKDYTRTLRIGSYSIEEWVIFPMGNKNKLRGVLVASVGKKDISDLIAILLNHADLMFENIILFEKLKKSNTELQEALSHVKTLRGLLPICANCKKIRDEKGYWNKVESYIKDHTDADFTHGICPECIKKLYPELSQFKD
ncbi:MAG: GAF domain-containing protein [Desulfobacterales bacterium]|nr:GAF domain-containing protein [Desulfobacterales bacterium]